MDTKKYTIVYKSGHEIQLARAVNWSPVPTNIRVAFEEYLKTGRQTEFAYKFSSIPPKPSNPDIDLVIDFRDISTILQLQE